jgi:DNA mismatch endonuclease (patch repair protein)
MQNQSDDIAIGGNVTDVTLDVKTCRPLPKSDAVSGQLSRMPRHSTQPELALRRALHAAGVRFTVNRKDLPGRPDLVLSRARLAVFVDGCFWHSCPEHGVMPKNNGEWWRAKLAGNVERDRRKDRELEELGWTVLHFWEHQPPNLISDIVTEMWKARTGRE